MMVTPNEPLVYWAGHHHVLIQNIYISRDSYENNVGVWRVLEVKVSEHPE